MDAIGYGIPSEIASDIFALCSLEIPLTLCFVSKQWQAIAWATPCLWTSIAVNIKPSATAASLAITTDLVGQWLKRSGALPLEIRLAYHGSASSRDSIDHALLHPLIDIFNAHVGRWRSLSLNIPSALISRFIAGPSTLCALDALQLNAIDKANNLRFDLIHTVPHVTSLSTTNMPLKSINITWDRIVDLEVASASVLDILAILPHATSLAHCKFDRIFLSVNADVSPCKPMIVSHLLTLQIQACNNAISALLSSVTLPSLEDLAITFRVSSLLPEDSLLSLFNRSLCSLTSLRLSGIITDEHTFVRFLYALPSTLKKLSITSYHTDMHPILTDDLFQEMTVGASKPDGDAATHHLLPNLETLEYEGTCTFEWSIFFLAISPPQPRPKPPIPPVPPRPLKSVKIWLQDYELEPMAGEDVLTAINLRDTGLSLRIFHLHAVDVESDWILSCPLLN